LQWSNDEMPTGTRFHAQGFLAWLPLSLAIAVGAGWLSVATMPYFSPVLLISVLWGLVLGGGLALGMQACRFAQPRAALAVALVSTLALVAAQHYFSYVAACRAAVSEQADMSMALRALGNGSHSSMTQFNQPAPPESFAAYLASEAKQGRPLLGKTIRGGWVWLSWVIDAAVIGLAASAVVAVMLKRPYCDTCQSWYRTMRSGEVSAAIAKTLARAAGLADVAERVPADRQRIAYRLDHCRSGCGPCRFELSWGPKADERTEAWLTAQPRRQIIETLDQPAGLVQPGDER
jgi:hypothetical protein